MAWKTIEEFEQELLADTDFRGVHQSTQAEYRIAGEILAARKASGMSQQALAKAVGTSQARVSTWERGEEVPRVDALQRIADATGRWLMVGLIPLGHQETTSKASQASKKKAVVRKKTTGRKKSTGRKRAAQRSAGGKATARKKATGKKSAGRKSAGARKTVAKRSAVRKSAGRKKVASRRKSTAARRSVRR